MENNFDDEDLTEEFDTITMTDEYGEEIEFAIIDSIDSNGQKYLLVVESELIDDEEADAVLLKETEGESSEELAYILVEDDEEFDKVADLFQRNGNEEYDIEID